MRIGKMSALEIAYRKFGAGSPEHIKELKAYELRIYGGFVSEPTTQQKA